MGRAELNPPPLPGDLSPVISTHRRVSPCPTPHRRGVWLPRIQRPRPAPWGGFPFFSGPRTQRPHAALGQLRILTPLPIDMPRRDHRLPHPASAASLCQRRRHRVRAAHRFVDEQVRGPGLPATTHLTVRTRLGRRRRHDLAATVRYALKPGFIAKTPSPRCVQRAPRRADCQKIFEFARKMLFRLNLPGSSHIAPYADPGTTPPIAASGPIKDRTRPVPATNRATSNRCSSPAASRNLPFCDGASSSATEQDGTLRLRPRPRRRRRNPARLPTSLRSKDRPTPPNHVPQRSVTASARLCAFKFEVRPPLDSE